MLPAYAKESASSLLGPLALSLALHAGFITLVEGVYGRPETGLSSARGLTSKALLVTIHSSATPGEVNSASEFPQGAPGATQRDLPEGLVSFPVPYYFPPEELSSKPRAVVPVFLDYPENAPLVSKKHIVLRLLINEHGSVDRTVVEDSDLPEELQGIAINAFGQSRFHPGMRNNAPVKSQLLVEITFEVDASSTPPSGLLPAR